MIGSIRGKIIHQSIKFLIVESGGVGYKVNITPEFSVQDKQAEIFLWIHTHIREDALDLYGFLENNEMEFFEMLISVSGIGPKGAMTILGVASTETLKKAIQTGDTSYLTKISGIGRKTAEKMVIELRDKVGKDITSGSLQEELDTLEALKSLGYSQNEVRDALKGIAPELDTNQKIREALKILGKK